MPLLKAFNIYGLANFKNLLTYSPLTSILNKKPQEMEEDLWATIVGIFFLEK